MCTSDTGFRSCVIYSGDKLFIARYVKMVQKMVSRWCQDGAEDGVKMVHKMVQNTHKHRLTRRVFPCLFYLLNTSTELQHGTPL